MLCFSDDFSATVSCETAGSSLSGSSAFKSIGNVSGLISPPRQERRFAHSNLHSIIAPALARPLIIRSHVVTSKRQLRRSKRFRYLSSATSDGPIEHGVNTRAPVFVTQWDDFVGVE